MSDKGDRSDKESEKSSMKVIGKGLWKPCHSCHSCHGRCVDRAALCITALTFGVMGLEFVLHLQCSRVFSDFVRKLPVGNKTDF